MGEMHLNTKFYLSSSIGVAGIKCRKMKNCQMTNFMKIGLKIKISNKYFWTNYNFWLLNSIPKMNFLSQKMTVQALVIFNRDYIAKNSKKLKNWHNFVKNEIFKNLKKYFFRIPEMHLNTKFYLSSSISVARIKWQKNEKLQNAKFHENRLKNPNFKKIFLDHL